MIQILTIIRDKEQDLELAGIAAAAVCGAGLTQPFSGGSRREATWPTAARWKFSAIQRQRRASGQDSLRPDSTRSSESPIQ